MGRPPKQKIQNEEPETTICTAPENVAPSAGSRMGKCKSCGIYDSHSEVDHLCYSCHKEVEGFEFDGEKKRWVKKVKKERK